MRQHAAIRALCFASLWLAAAPQPVQAQSCLVGGVSVPCAAKEPGAWEVGQSIFGQTSSLSQSTNFNASGSSSSIIGNFLGQSSNGGNRAYNPSSASVVVSSSASTATSPSASSNQIQYGVVNSGSTTASSSSSTSTSTSASTSTTSAPVAINWQASSSSSSSATSASSDSGISWLAQLLEDSDDERDNLANRTGLKVKL